MYKIEVLALETLDGRYAAVDSLVYSHVPDMRWIELPDGYVVTKGCLKKTMISTWFIKRIYPVKVGPY